MDQRGRNAQGLITTRSNTIMIVPSNTPKDSADGIKRSSTSNTSIEFRKSIDKIYELMDKLGKTEALEAKLKKSKFTARSNDEQKLITTVALEGSTAQCTESGTSVKHHILSSTPSYISFDKYKACDDDNYCVEAVVSKSSESKNPEETTVIIPKVIINNKTPPPDPEKNVIRKKPTDHSPIQVNENPLKAISQLLHDIDNVQKTRQKPNSVIRSPNRREIQKPTDTRTNVRPNPSSRKQGKYDQKLNPKNKLNQGDHIKNPLLDIVDEYKEARGEAVRGPSKINSRLNTLAQPKKSYVQAHMEEYQTRYGKNVMSERLQKLSTVQAPSTPAKPRPPYPKNKPKKTGTDTGVTLSVKRTSSPSSPLDKMSKYKHVGNNEMSIPQSQTEFCRKQDNSPVKQENIKNKMVAVESYVKNHYGRSSPPASSARWNLMSRAPLIPNDLGYTSSFESTNSPERSASIGRKLHNIIDTIIINTQTGLSCVSESNESNSKENNSTGNLSKEDRASVLSDYYEYEFEHRSVQGEKKNAPCSVTTDGVQQFDAQTFAEAINNVDTKTELEKLENALHRKLSSGAFHKRLRIRNLTLTPKHSLQQTVVLQSGDCNTSFVVKSTLSQNFKTKNCKSEVLAQLKALSSVSNTHISWNHNIPMHISTVGYAFPTLKRVPLPVVELSNNKSVARNLPAQNNDKINRMLDKKDDSCDSGNQAQFGDFDNALNTNNNLSSTVIYETKQNDKSEENNPQYVSEIEDEVVKKKMTGSSEKAVKASNKSEETKTLVNNVIDSSRSIQSDNIGCSSSLDILVCLLNEIQKITTCGLHTEGLDSNQQSTQFMAVFNEASNLRDSVPNQVKDVISIASLEKLRRVQSKHSIFSFYIANDGRKNKHSYETKLISMDVVRSNNEVDDKEVNVNIQEKELVHACTDVTSKFLPVTFTSGTHMSNSLIGIISEPSTQSIINLNDEYSNLLTAHKKIIEIPQQRESINEKATEISKKVITEKIAKIKVRQGDKKLSDIVKLPRNCDSFVNGVIARNSDALGTDEQVMKIKRDVLVTLYSILVFTVFAALSFPDMLSRV